MLIQNVLDIANLFKPFSVKDFFKLFCVSLAIFLCTNLHSLSVGFAIDLEHIFLEKNENPYYPEIISSFASSMFLKKSIVFNNGSFSIAPGFFIDSTYNEKKREINKISAFPFIKNFNLSLFSEYFSFTFAKEAVSFGEGFFNINNYFFLNLASIKKDHALYHLYFEVPKNQFLFKLGGACDTKAIDHYKKPDWYSVWFFSSYSTSIFSGAFESDILFEVGKEKKDATLKMAGELLFTLPKDFKLYTSAKLPFSLYKKQLAGWGIFMGVSKSFIFEDNNATTILGASYSNEGAGYSIFQNIGIGDAISLSFGGVGKNKDSFHLIFESEFYISELNLKISYATKNFIKKEEMQGMLSIGVSFNE